MNAWFLALVFAGVPAGDEFTITQGFSIKGNAAPKRSSNYVDPMIRYMEDDQRWIDALPKNVEPRLKEILSRKMIPYDHEVLPRVNQMFHGEVFHGDYFVAVPGHPFGAITLDPQWRHTAGFPESTKVVTYLVFPDEGDIEVWQAPARATGAPGNGKVVRSEEIFYHQFPVGMVLLEAGFNKVGNELLCFEIRTRTKVEDKFGASAWRPNRYVPCRDPQELDEAIEKATGKRLGLLSMFSKDKYRKHTLSFALKAHRYRPEEAEFPGYEVTMPTLEATTSAHILKNTPFRSSFDKEWATLDDGVCAAPTTDAPDQIYPPKYQGGYFPTSFKTCIRCHNDDGKQAFDDIGDGDWYGYIPGSDGIRSWTPIKPVYGGIGQRPQVDPRIASSPRIKVLPRGAKGTP